MRCQYLSGSVYIESNGDVRPCCAHINHGNLDEVGVIDAFSGERANNLRRTMHENDEANLPAACVNCVNLMRVPGDGSETFGLMGDPANFAIFPAFAENGLALKQSFDEEIPVEVGRGPLSMIVQLGELCNIQCIMCPQDHRSKLKIKPEHVRKIKEALPYVNYLTLSGGEPLVFEETWDILNEYQRQPQPKYVSILTNGKLLRPDRLKKHAMGIERINFGINIDAGTKETYEHIRDGASWDVLMQNIADFQKFRDEHGLKWYITLGFTIMQSNIEEIEKAVELSDRIGVGAITFGPVTGDCSPVKNCRTYLNENIFRFSHIGWTRDGLADRLHRAASYMQARHPEWTSSINGLHGVAQYAMTVGRIDIDPMEAAHASKCLNDETLSDFIKHAMDNPGMTKLVQHVIDRRNETIAAQKKEETDLLKYIDSLKVELSRRDEIIMAQQKKGELSRHKFALRFPLWAKPSERTARSKNA